MAQPAATSLFTLSSNLIAGGADNRASVLQLGPQLFKPSKVTTAADGKTTVNFAELSPLDKQLEIARESGLLRENLTLIQKYRANYDPQQYLKDYSNKIDSILKTSVQVYDAAASNLFNAGLPRLSVEEGAKSAAFDYVAKMKSLLNLEQPIGDVNNGMAAVAVKGATKAIKADAL